MLLQAIILLIKMPWAESKLHSQKLIKMCEDRKRNV